MEAIKKHYNHDFKLKIVKLSFEKVKLEDIAREFNITYRTLWNWRRIYIINGEENFSVGKTKLTAREKKIYDLEIKTRKLNTEFKIIKGAADYLQKGPPFIFEYIAKNEQNYSNYMMCKILGIDLGSYNKWKNEYVSERQKWKNMVKEEIASIFISSQKRYGSKRITAELQRSGYQLSSDTVLRYMRELNLSVSVKKCKTRT
ncbi:IS3 family transposase [Flavobacterium sp. KBS0721]|uniref:IS3 family transposase n=1 Tax=Flavobacterium sp. KBS0721 TaxID=1179672 RepID=UPI00098FB0D9|nr:IS3 family transposase [Flavobacterium sp. KBS0721]QDW21047.1 IS3 family transposase [Flavobacterium sp. KBS0721]